MNHTGTAAPGDKPAPLLAPVTTLKGVGPRVAGRLERLGIRTVQDLLFHLPLRYQDRTRVTPLGALRAGMEAVVRGEVRLAQMHYGKRPALLVYLADGTGSLILRFFHFSAAQRETLKRGARLRCFGEVRDGPAQLEIVHPEYRVTEGDEEAAEECLTPVYPATEGLHQISLRNLIRQALERLEPIHSLHIPPLPPGEGGRNVDDSIDELPAAISARFHFPSLRDALLYVHRPPPDASIARLEEGKHPAQQRLAFEELLAHHLSLRRLRARSEQRAAPVLDPPGALVRNLLARLPFTLTAAQRRVLEEINADLRRPHPMHRLVQGDVGSGKTVVAACAVLQAVEAGHQTAVMAPTELLAEQHARNFAQWLEPLGVETAYLAGKHSGKARATLLARLAAGDIPVVVGTHALFQQDVAFKSLALVVIDEQHRFGVHQRLALREKGLAPPSGEVASGEKRGAREEGRTRSSPLSTRHSLLSLHPHQLVMTATPIPRTLAMVAYADLDCSVIDELPPGRTPVETVALPESRRDEVVRRVRAACREGRQAYWVCTLIEESETLQCQAAEDTAGQLRAALPDLRIALVHGRLKSREKEQLMRDFKSGALDLLVATTVIEVGVDVPNASLMVIENAERLGLAQLHQLRGRVGRGAQRSVCVLLYHPPLSQRGRARLAVLRETSDGFEIARRDLELRGPGEVLGTRQSGEMNLKIADLLRDQSLIPHVERIAETLLREHPARVAPLIKRWLGESLRFGET